MTDYITDITTILSDRFGVSTELIAPRAHLRQDLNLSDLEITEIITSVTQKFALNLPQELDVKSIATVEDLTSLVENYSAEL